MTINLLDPQQSSVEQSATITASDFLAISGATLTQDTSTSWQGSASLKVVTPGSVNFEGLRIARPSAELSPSTQYTFSVYLWGSGNVILIGNGSILGNVGTQLNITLTSSPTRYSVTFTLPATLSGNIGATVRTNGIQAATWHMDGMQLELGGTATSWVVGTAGTVQGVLAFPSEAYLAERGILTTIGSLAFASDGFLVIPLTILSGQVELTQAAVNTCGLADSAMNLCTITTSPVGISS